jgi:glycosyltransferase involved in cell wall biosynthesis
MPDGRSSPVSLVVLIPALKPSAAFLSLLDELGSSISVKHIIVVNDGSPSNYDAVFDEAALKDKVTILRHAVNLGKGAALRTGINYFLCRFGPDSVLVTADADGQHHHDDILAVGVKAASEAGSLVLGERCFAGQIPLRSKLGNILTRKLFALFVGQEVRDTQTGLRAIPLSLLPSLMRIRANGYDFEMEMLMCAAQKQVNIESVPIRTIYEEGNRTSHFNPVRDSMRIYFVFARFLSSSALTALIDYGIFHAAFAVTGSLSTSMCAGRLVAGTFNFVANKLFVFHSRSSLAGALLRYVMLVATLGFLAYFLIDELVRRADWNPYAAKISVESMLLFASFLLQRTLVFAQNRTRVTESSSKTNWDDYYQKPYATAGYSRRISEKILTTLILKYGEKDRLRIVELGGANSCFYEGLLKAVKPASYDIIDNNETGLIAFRQKIPADACSYAHHLDVLSADMQSLSHQYDVCFSVGLIEHFDEENTARTIGAHFDLLKPGGLAIITYPTPTWLYRVTRRIAEIAGQWIFWDERPLGHQEVERTVSNRGQILVRKTNWWIFLTQGIVVARKHLEPISIPSSDAR